MELKKFLVTIFFVGLISSANAEMIKPAENLSAYDVIKIQLKKEQEKFKSKYFDLTEEKTESVKKQKTYKEILAFTNISKI